MQLGALMAAAGRISSQRILDCAAERPAFSGPCMAECLHLIMASPKLMSRRRLLHARSLAAVAIREFHMPMLSIARLARRHLPDARIIAGMRRRRVSRLRPGFLRNTIAATVVSYRPGEAGASPIRSETLLQLDTLLAVRRYFSGQTGNTSCLRHVCPHR